MKEDFAFWKKALVKGLVSGGLTFFSIFATTGAECCWKPAVVAAGTYICVEATKYYNIQPEKKVLNKSYSFLI